MIIMNVVDIRPTRSSAGVRRPHWAEMDGHSISNNNGSGGGGSRDSGGSGSGSRDSSSSSNNLMMMMADKCRSAWS